MSKTTRKVTVDSNRRLSSEAITSTDLPYKSKKKSVFERLGIAGGGASYEVRTTMSTKAEPMRPKAPQRVLVSNDECHSEEHKFSSRQKSFSEEHKFSILFSVHTILFVLHFLPWNVEFLCTALDEFAFFDFLRWEAHSSETNFGGSEGWGCS